jgi:hypothetical protein
MRLGVPRSFGLYPRQSQSNAHALDKSLANHSMIQIIQYDVQMGLPRLRNRWVVNPKWERMNSRT